MELWIARNKNGDLWLYKDKPTLSMSGKAFTSGIFGDFFSIDIPEVTFENSPQKVKIELDKKE